MATVQTVIDMVKWQTDLQKGNRLLGADLLPFINLAYKDAWGRIVSAYEDHFVKKPSDFAIAGGVGASSYDIAALTDFYRVRAVLKQSGSRWTDPLPLWEVGNWGSPDELSYRLLDTTLQLLPEESCAGTYRLWYVYLPGDLLLTPNPSTLVDINGKVLQYIVDTIGVRVKGREEEESALLERLRGELVADLASFFSHRQGRPKRIADVRGARRFRFMTKSGLRLP